MPLTKHKAKIERQQAQLSVDDFVAFLKREVALYSDKMQLDVVDMLIKQYAVTYITTPYKQTIIELLQLATPYYEQQQNERFAQFLCIKGHAYFYTGDYMKANAYYQQSIALATKLKQYHIVSAAMSNVITQKLKIVPTDTAFHMTKILPILHRMREDANPKQYYSKLLAHIEVAYDAQKWTYMMALIERIEEMNIFQAGDRQYYQLLYFKACYRIEQSQCQQAREAIFEIIDHYMTTKREEDIVLRLEPHLQTIMEQNVSVNTTVSLQQAINEVNERLMDAQQVLHIQQKKDEQTGEHIVKQWLALQQNVTLIWFENKELSHEKWLHLQQKVDKHLTEMEVAIVCSTASTYCLCIKQCSELLTKQLLKVMEIHSVVRTSLIMQSQSTYEQCMHVARAQIYYQMYK